MKKAILIFLIFFVPVLGFAQSSASGGNDIELTVSGCVYLIVMSPYETTEHVINCPYATSEPTRVYLIVEDLASGGNDNRDGDGGRPGGDRASGGR